LLPARAAAPTTGLDEELDVQLWQSSHELHRLETYRDHPLEQLKRIGWVSDRLDGIAVGVIDDAAVLIGRSRPVKALWRRYAYRGYTAIAA